MITLYHGSDCIVRRPEIREPNRTLDFGRGFYLTSSCRQAEEWVVRHAQSGAGRGYVNTFAFDMKEARARLRVLAFASPSTEWLDFVMANRRIAGFTHDYDVVVGPVANDRVYTAFSLYESGVISKGTLIDELRTYRLIDQYLLHTPAALGLLSFTNVTTVSL